MKFGKPSYFENPILLFTYLPHILTTSQLLGSNLGEGGAVRDNAGAAVCMVGAALKASVGAKRSVSGESFPVRGARDQCLVP